MCGIAGFIKVPGMAETPIGQCAEMGSFAANKKQFRNYINFFELALLNMATKGYGSHATGIFVGKNLSRGHIAPRYGHSLIQSDKEGCSAKEFVKSRKFTSISNVANRMDEMLYSVGHVRQATSGTPKMNENNHPFRNGSVIGVHNGMISNDKEIVKDNDDVVVRGTCDSEPIFSLLDVNLNDSVSYKSAIRSTVKQLSGWLSCVAADSTRYRQLMFFRRDGPLSLLCDKKFGYISFCSGMQPLRDSLTAASIASENFEEIPYKENQGMVIEIDKVKSIEDIKPFSLDTKKKQNEYSEKPF